MQPGPGTGRSASGVYEQKDAGAADEQPRPAHMQLLHTANPAIAARKCTAVAGRRNGNLEEAWKDRSLRELTWTPLAFEDHGCFLFIVGLACTKCYTRRLGSSFQRLHEVGMLSPHFADEGMSLEMLRS